MIRRKRRNWSGLGGSYTLKKKMPEDDLQECFAQWLTDNEVLHTASCAGMRTFPKVMAKMKRMGARKGVPDIMIFEPNKRYHGLFIELKSQKGRPTKEQIAWRDALNYKMYHAAIMPSGLDFGSGLEWCKKLVTDYMNMK